MYGYTFQLHENDREDHAKRLGLTLGEFDRLLISANNAYQVIKDLGPFYGKEENKEPTFRITSDPVVLPKGSEQTLTILGNDLLYLARALQKLPEGSKEKLGEDLDFTVPFSWRIDAIITPSGDLRVNEIECVDSASALMTAEQLAYNLQPINESTAAKMIKAFQSIYPTKTEIHLALIRNDLENNPHTTNHTRLIEFIEKISQGQVKIDLIDELLLQSLKTMPDWGKYDGVMNETSISPSELEDFGVVRKKLIAAGNFSALNNKGVFALLFDESHNEFWQTSLGQDRFNRLKGILIPTEFILLEKDIDRARQQGEVVKASWAGTNTVLINRSKGVAIPEGDIIHGSNERWESLKELFNQGVKIISQDFIKPAQIPAFLRKKGLTLEAVEWYNRVCVKYVVEGNPNGDEIPSVSLTATEVTLGPDIVPAGRKCAFTAGTF